MKRMLDGLTAVHSARRPYGPRSDWFPTQRAIDIRRSNSAQAEVEHPVIRTHPETIRFSGMSEESAPLLDYLYRHLMRPEFTCRFRWSAQRHRLLRQPLRPALRDQRLPRPAPGHAPRHRQRRPPLLARLYRWGTIEAVSPRPAHTMLYSAGADRANLPTLCGHLYLIIGSTA
jgi:hypothetical protein